MTAIHQGFAKSNRVPTSSSPPTTCVYTLVVEMTPLHLRLFIPAPYDAPESEVRAAHRTIGLASSLDTP
jgi:hypothetical protein